jgi:hypothetical protein
MKLTSKKITGATTTLFTFASLGMTTLVARADEYCIKDGAQIAFGCGYVNLEQCRARASGIGGICKMTPSVQSLSDALAYQPNQPNSRVEPPPKKESAGR